jgi:hypothetical protein
MTTKQDALRTALEYWLPKEKPFYGAIGSHDRIVAEHMMKWEEHTALLAQSAPPAQPAAQAGERELPPLLKGMRPPANTIQDWYAADQIRERDAMWQEKLRAAVAQALAQSPASEQEHGPNGTWCNGCTPEDCPGCGNGEQAQVAREPAQISLAERIAELAVQHGSLRAAGRVLDVDAGYLSRLASGEKDNPDEQLLRRMGLRRIVTYERRRATPPAAAPVEKMRTALERIADPRNTHFAGDAQVVARDALTANPPAQEVEQERMDAEDTPRKEK